MARVEHSTAPGRIIFKVRGLGKFSEMIRNSFICDFPNYAFYGI